MSKLILSDDQKIAMDALKSGKSTFLTGGAGTGKSTLIKTFCEQNKVARLATTGAAAVLLRGQTAASFFKIPITVHKPNDIRDRKSHIPHVAIMKVASFDAFIVDEISMMRIDQFQAMLEMMSIAQKARRGKAFQLITVGDFAQLPPVITREESAVLRKYYGERLFAFEHSGWDRLDPHLLSVIHRQSGDQAYASWLSDVRLNRPIDVGYVNERVGPPPANAVRLVATNKAASVINDQRMDALPGPDLILRARTVGEFSESNAKVKAEYRMRKGARVIICQNNLMGGYVNGSTGTLLEIHNPGKPTQTARVELDNGKIVNVINATWENISYERDSMGEYVSKPRGSFTQMPLLPGWAITIHRSQGMSLPQVHADLGGVFEAGQGYVALSRATSLAGLSLARPINVQDLMVNPIVSDYHERMDERIRERAMQVSVPDSEIRY